jgi:hypothetical protein
MGNDKNYIMTIDSNYNLHRKSKAHKDFFNDIMNFMINDNKNFDCSSEIHLQMFPSNKHGFKKEVLNGIKQNL